MDTFLILFISLMIVSFSTIGFFLYMEWLRRDQQNVKAHFIYDDESFVTKKFSKIDKTITYDKNTYTYDDKAILRKGKRRHIYYRVGVPSPLIFEGEGKPTYSSSNLNTLLETDLWDKLFRKDNPDFKILKLMVTITMLLLVGLGIYLFMSKGDSTLITNDANRLFIEEAVRNALL